MPAAKPTRMDVLERLLTNQVAIMGFLMQSDPDNRRRQEMYEHFRASGHMLKQLGGESIKPPLAAHYQTQDEGHG
jgi:hypothetical protein